MISTHRYSGFKRIVNSQSRKVPFILPSCPARYLPITIPRSGCSQGHLAIRQMHLASARQQSTNSY